LYSTLLHTNKLRPLRADIPSQSSFNLFYVKWYSQNDTTLNWTLCSNVSSIEFGWNGAQDNRRRPSFIFDVPVKGHNTIHLATPCTLIVSFHLNKSLTKPINHFVYWIIYRRGSVFTILNCTFWATIIDFLQIENCTRLLRSFANSQSERRLISRRTVFGVTLMLIIKFWEKG
jgi:hypothetical protein